MNMKAVCPNCHLLVNVEPVLRKDKPKEWKPTMGHWGTLAWKIDQWNYVVICPFCGDTWRFLK